MDQQSQYASALGGLANGTVRPEVRSPLMPATPSAPPMPGAPVPNAGMPHVGPQGQPNAGAPQQPEKPEYNVATDPAWAHLPITHMGDHADFLNAQKPEIRAKILQLLMAHSAMGSPQQQR